MVSDDRFDIAVVGSGLAGSILARVLNDRGLSVVLIERGRHPRFALGESSTPLAALALERLAASARTPGTLDDLAHLSTAGLWPRHLPHLGRGTKRGFTFWRHRPTEPLRGGPDERLLVAASPTEDVADNHWLRQDVDAHLVNRAVEAGVFYRDETEVTAIEQTAGGVSLKSTWHPSRAPETKGFDEPYGQNVAPSRTVWHPGEPVEIRARFLVDATGPAGLLARCFDLPHRPTRLNTALLAGHFEAMPGVAETAPGAVQPPGPYPDDRAAVHHLLPGVGWAYALPFDHPGPGRPERTSFGVVLTREAADRVVHLPPDEALSEVVRPYPTLAAQLARARAVEAIRRTDRLAFRLDQTVGERWLVLPGGAAFFDPLFSTGIAWSVLGVERAAELLESGVPSSDRLAEYSALLAREADHLEHLIATAWQAMGDFRSFVALTHVYFAAASFSETVQRLRDRRSDRVSAWEPFLGAGDEVIRGALGGVVERLKSGVGGEEIERFVARAIEPRNVAGLADPARRNLYPADVDVAAQRAELVEATAEQVRRALTSVYSSVD